MLNQIGFRNYDNAGGIDNIGISRLAKTYSRTVKARRLKDASIENELKLSIPHLESLKKKLSEEIKETDNISGYLPVTSVFDALQIIKNKKNARSNAGLRALGGHLDKMWKEDRTASLSANSFLNLRDHYTRNFPKSGLDGVFDEIAEKGYFTLPMSDLLHIASQIQNQEDFDKMIVKYGLNGRSPHQVKSRKFILAAVNG